jgi:threonine synthase
MWAYRHHLPSAGAVIPGQISLNERITPLRPLGPGRWVKCEYELPTGSFKARGAAVMVGLAAGLGVRRLVVDSSGNAGKAAAAYSALAGLAAEIHVPASTPPAKVEAMRSFGADVVVDPGDRQAASTAARRRVAAGSGWYASHVYQPSFHHGVKTLAFELFDQMPEVVDGTVAVPVGNGTLILGLWLGFRELMAEELTPRMPRLVGVQSERCAPMAGLKPVGATCANGIFIPNPPRLGQVRAALMASGGVVTTVSEEEIEAAVGDLAASGLRVEPTGAVAWAAVRRLQLAEPVVAVLSGG